MPAIVRPLDPRHGAMLPIRVMQSDQYVEALKKAGLPFASPTTILAILDTGASGSAIDKDIVNQLSLQYRGYAEIHTPSTGPNVDYRGVYDATVVIGEGLSPPLVATLPLIECEFASRGFYALIGRDILNRCVLTFDGPAGSFHLSWL